MWNHSILTQIFNLTNFRNRLFVGLSKLTEANSLVDTMQEELVNLGPKIEEKAKVYNFLNIFNSEVLFWSIIKELVLEEKLGILRQMVWEC